MEIVDFIEWTLNMLLRVKDEPIACGALCYHHLPEKLFLGCQAQFYEPYVGSISQLKDGSFFENLEW